MLKLYPHSLFPPSLCCALGIFVGIAYAFTPLYACLLLGGTSFLFFTIKRKRLWLATFLIGTLLGVVRHQWLHRTYTIIEKNLQESNPLTTSGYITAVCNKTENRFSQDIYLQTKPGALLKISCRNKTAYMPGDEISVRKLRLAPPATGEYRSYLAKEGIHATAFCGYFFAKLKKRTTNNITRFFSQIKEHLINVPSANIETQRLFSRIFLGAPLPQDPITREQFNAWGIAHYLARSGLHVTFIIVLWGFLLRLFFIPLLWRNVITIFLVIIYALFSWYSISFFRAIMFFLLSSACVLCNVPLYSLHLFGIATSLFMLHNPYIIFFLDFQLSFSLSGALIWYAQNKARHKKTVDKNKTT